MKNIPLYSSLLILMIYYVISIFLLLNLKVLEDKNFFAFYINSKATKYISDAQELSLQAQRNILFFFKKDPDINEELADYYKRKNNFAEANSFYISSLLNDPKNNKVHNDYFNFLINSKNHDQEIYEELLHLNSIYLPITESEKIEELLPFEKIKQYLNAENLTANQPSTDYLANIYYSLGLAMLQSEPNTIKSVWKIIYDLHPGWSYFYIDFAAFMKYRYADIAQAEDILHTCQKDRNAQEHCNEFSIDTLPTHSLLKDTVIF